jgi:hypothetical protein
MRELAGFAFNERDRQKRATLQADLTAKIIEAQAQFLEIHGAIVEKDRLVQSLSERIRELESRDREKERYRLAKLGTLGEFFAYQLRPAGELAERVDEPAHFLCQICFDAGKKSVLVGNGNGFWKCDLCGRGVQADPDSPLPSYSFRSERRAW